MTYNEVLAERPYYETFYLTFGNNHVNPVTGQSLFTYYVRIPAPDYEWARRLVIGRLYNGWSMLYTAEEFGDQAEQYTLNEWVWEFPDLMEGH